MSPRRPAPEKPEPSENPEGWESLGEASGGSLASSPELEEALREAAAAVDPADSAGGQAPHEELLLDEPVAAGEPAHEVEDLSARLVESQDRLLRLQADFENFRRRALKERQETLQYGHQNLVKDLLGAVDNLDRAIEHAQKSTAGDLKSLLQGVELVRRELLGSLAKHGVSQVEALGKPFDPALMEAMAQSPDGSVAPNTVIEEFQKGYLLRDRLLRPASVVVAKAPEDDTGERGGGGG